MFPIAVLCLICGVQSSLVIQLQEKTVSSTIQQGQWFIRFTVPDHKNDRVWEQLATDVKKAGSKVNIAQVDCTEAKDLCKAWEIKTFPLYKIIINRTEKFETYTGGLTLAELTKYVLEEGWIEREDPYAETAQKWDTIINDFFSVFLGSPIASALVFLAGVLTQNFFYYGFRKAKVVIIPAEHEN